jgi:hypothetical protein
MSTPSAAYEREPMMGEPHFADDDDLPRTLRRERDAREREMRNRERQARAHRDWDAREGEAGFRAPRFVANDYDDEPRSHPAPAGGVVERLQIPFLHLTLFFVKAVFAAIPALLVLAVLLWLGGKGLETAFPNLSRMQILIHFPK